MQYLLMSSAATVRKYVVVWPEEPSTAVILQLWELINYLRQDSKLGKETAYKTSGGLFDRGYSTERTSRGFLTDQDRLVSCIWFMSSWISGYMLIYKGN